MMYINICNEMYDVNTTTDRAYTYQLDIVQENVYSIASETSTYYR